ncbi:MAG: DNA protecting protein DprA [Candidatus Portnoybacteria bacterium RBG_19FT_COMBO_36_7]|uniref:DNA protecting protein DprA n=1 Tax=Candidatus Portnoybacteria bacterium RBG_19FT_COMBO_36_7 TaxID=1801992 RepID=A0A1G2F5P6_9BACT|nr:MAG: DNA protecting protein DprA [Candidatus Portnoybacteria bacterium RBG_19FT_COMBO_36_7]
MHEQTKYFVAFNQSHEHIGPQRIKKLLNFFGTLQNAWNAQASELINAGLEENIVTEFCAGRINIEPDKELEKVLSHKIDVVTILDENYPRLLKEIYDPPPILYVRGGFVPQDEKALAIVGTRMPSVYGQQAASHLAGQIAQAGLTIISGLARGIDSIAHLAALQNNKRTIAVVGSGIDEPAIYPPSNRKLAQQISENGAVISEYPIGCPALKHHFHARNRVISGLSLGTLVVEAKEKSGALITAAHALEQNREIFAIPGPIYSQTSAGPNNLIKMGAKLVLGSQDILDELNLRNLTEQIQIREILPDNEEEAKILQILGDEPAHIDKIVNDTKMDTATVNATLSLMEIKGKIKNMGGMNYILAR